MDRVALAAASPGLQGASSHWIVAQAMTTIILKSEAAMNGEYWVYEVEGGDMAVTYARSADEALHYAGRKGGKPIAGGLTAVTMQWFAYDPILVESCRIDGRERISLRDQFFGGGSIGCDAEGLEIMFVPHLLPEPSSVGEGDAETTVYGEAVLRVKDRPEMGYSLRLEGLDDAHLIDRLSGEVALVVGRARKLEASVPMPVR